MSDCPKAAPARWLGSRPASTSAAIRPTLRHARTCAWLARLGARVHAALQPLEFLRGPFRSNFAIGAVDRGWRLRPDQALLRGVGAVAPDMAFLPMKTLGQRGPGVKVGGRDPRALCQAGLAVHPRCIFMPKKFCLALQVWCKAESSFLSRLYVELGAPMVAARTRSLHRPMPTNRRSAVLASNACSHAAAARLNHCWTTCMRSIRSRPTGGGHGLASGSAARRQGFAASCDC